VWVTGRVTGWVAGWVLDRGADEAADEVAGLVGAIVDGVSDGAALDELAGWADELLASADEEVPASMSGIFDSVLDTTGWEAVCLAGADPIVTTSTAQPPTARAAVQVEIS